MEYNPENWKDGAACKDMDPTLFFPVGGDAKTVPAKAAEACGECTVRHLCEGYAIKNRLDEGVWAGVNFSDKQAREALKRAIYRQRRKAS